MAEVMTYTSLVDQLKVWVERYGDTIMTAEIPTVISQVEVQLARELKTLLFEQSVTSSFVAGQSWIPKPVRWRETISLNYGTGTNSMTRNIVLPRTYDYCRMYWPDPEQTGLPKYCADYTWNYLLIVPTPTTAYPYELIYYERLTPLDDSNQTNLLTQQAPDLLFKGCMAYLAQYLKNPEDVKRWSDTYDRALMTTKGEDVSRSIYRANSWKKGQ